jgi:hypothetical protein
MKTYHSFVEQHHSYRLRDDGVDFPCSQDLFLNILIFHHSLDDPDLVLHMWVLVTRVCLFYELVISIPRITVKIRLTTAILSAIDDASSAMTCLAPAWAEMKLNIPDPGISVTHQE